MMPDMTGLEVLERIKEDERLAGIPVLFHSASADLKRRDQAVALGQSTVLLRAQTRSTYFPLAFVNCWADDC